MENKKQSMEDLIERSIDSVTTHPAFLMAVTTLINANSYRKILMRKSIEAIWKDLELPVRREQEKLVCQLEELTVRVKRLELSKEMQDEGRNTAKAKSAIQATATSNKVRSKEMELQ